MATKKCMDAGQPEFTFAHPVITPRGDGTFIVSPGKPSAREIPTREAARILGVCRAQIWYIRNQTLGRKLLRWRFTSELKGKILWELDSVIAYRDATRSLED